MCFFLPLCIHLLFLSRSLSHERCHSRLSFEEKFRFYWHLFRQIAYHKWKHQYKSNVPRARTHTHTCTWCWLWTGHMKTISFWWYACAYNVCMCVCLWILLQFKVLASLFSKKFLLPSRQTHIHEYTYYQFWQATKWLWQNKIDLSVWMWKMCSYVLYTMIWV